MEAEPHVWRDGETGYTRYFKDGTWLKTVYHKMSWWVKDKRNDLHCGPFSSHNEAKDWIEAIIDNSA